MLKARTAAREVRTGRSAVPNSAQTTVSADYHAPLHGTYLLRKPKAGEQS